ncbi:MAG: carboxypeptidase regulatory-like domain-containing protein [Acidobacteria bacterium]|nr:carboxypeptidase regulatory-like domain-containing protein [Acidobacteriota bacterium]
MSTLLALQPCVTYAQRAIQNPSVEAPAIANNTYHRISEGTLTGWLTTHPLLTCAVGPETCRPIERWGTGFNSVNAAAGAGNAFVELNAEAISMIYQPICMTNGESFDFSFLHRGRSSDTTADVADFRIGIPTGLPDGSKPADSYNYPILRVSTANDGNPNGQAIPPGGSSMLTTNRTNVSAGNGWRRYGGRYLYTGPTQVVNLGFSAVSTAGGNVTIGNFIDDWNIQLAPYVEAAAVDTAALEGSSGGSHTPANGSRPALRISGTVGTGGAMVTVNVIGGTGIAGFDYSMTEPFAFGNTTNSVLISIPAGTYDGVNTGVFNLPFSTNGDTVIESNRTVEFEVGSVSGNAVLASLGSCGQAPITQFTHTIVDDDMPSSSGITVTGRVLESAGRGISQAKVILTDSEGNIRNVSTNGFGYFQFESLKAGETFIVSVSSRRHTFRESTRVFMADGLIEEIVFTAN